jgi:hypothetical protein|eukprot:COSAG06_NODE_8027_length_2295_cov_16.040984_1_plen_296_part_00
MLALQYSALLAAVLADHPEDATAWRLRPRTALAATSPTVTEPHGSCHGPRVDGEWVASDDERALRAPTAVASAEACCAACDGEPQCFSWVFHRRHTNCTLRHAFPERVRLSRDAVAGVGAPPLGGGFHENFAAWNGTLWDWRGSSSMITHGTTSTLMRRDHLRYSPSGGLAMRMDETPCRANHSDCCCVGHAHDGVSSLSPCVGPNVSTPSGDRTCATWASSHLLSRQRYGFGRYTTSIKFSPTQNAKMFFVVGDNYLTPPHQEIDVVVEDGCGDTPHLCFFFPNVTSGESKNRE